jgi:predicted DNA-binding transcriptional regulator YafY
VTESTVYDNELKLDLAAENNFQARFDYTHDGETKRRTVTVEDFDGEYVEGDTEDGYRRFRVDRIEGKVVIR